MTDFWRGPKIGAFPFHMEGNGRGWYHSIRMETAKIAGPAVTVGAKQRKEATGGLGTPVR